MIVNNKIEIQFPDTLSIMDEEKRKQMNFLADGEGYCLENKEKHILISIGWRKIGLFAKTVLNINDLSKGLEKNIRNGMQPFSYTKENDLEMSLDGEVMRGIRYTYIASNIDMVAESYVVKHGKEIYYFHYYSRKTLNSENKKTWSDILQSAKWIR